MRGRIFTRAAWQGETGTLHCSLVECMNALVPGACERHAHPIDAWSAKMRPRGETLCRTPPWSRIDTISTARQDPAKEDPDALR